MTRAEFINTREFWLTEIQLQLFELIENYRKKNNLNKTQIAEKLGVTKGYVTQILKGDFDHKISKLVDLSLTFGKVPVIHFVDKLQYIQDDAQNRQHIYKQDFNPVNYITIFERNPHPMEDINLPDSFKFETPIKDFSYA